MQLASLDYGLQLTAKDEDRYIDFRLFDEINTDESHGQYLVFNHHRQRRFDISIMQENSPGS